VIFKTIALSALMFTAISFSAGPENIQAPQQVPSKACSYKANIITVYDRCKSCLPIVTAYNDGSICRNCEARATRANIRCLRGECCSNTSYIAGLFPHLVHESRMVRLAAVNSLKACDYPVDITHNVCTTVPPGLYYAPTK
jgi:hypothetical protein